MVGFPNNHGVFLLKMIILGCEMGVPPFKETPINYVYIYIHILFLYAVYMIKAVNKLI